MDSARFDGLLRHFGQIRSRRQTLRGLAGAVVVGALALDGRAASADTCKGTDKGCTKNSQCCSGSCTPPGGKGPVARSASICCPAGQTNCGGHCASCPDGGVCQGQRCCLPAGATLPPENCGPGCYDPAPCCSHAQTCVFNGSSYDCTCIEHAG